MPVLEGRVTAVERLTSRKGNLCAKVYIWPEGWFYDWLDPDWWFRNFPMGKVHGAEPVEIGYDERAKDGKTFRHIAHVGFVVEKNVQIVPEQGDWVKELFNILPFQHRQRVYRALAAAFHPDVGGDQEVMKRVNVAYDGG